MLSKLPIPFYNENIPREVIYYVMIYFNFTFVEIDFLEVWEVIGI